MVLIDFYSNVCQSWDVLWAHGTDVRVWWNHEWFSYWFHELFSYWLPLPGFVDPPECQPRPSSCSGLSHLSCSLCSGVCSCSHCQLMDSHSRDFLCLLLTQHSYFWVSPMAHACGRSWRRVRSLTSSPLSHPLLSHL